MNIGFCPEILHKCSWLCSLLQISLFKSLCVCHSTPWVKAVLHICDNFAAFRMKMTSKRHIFWLTPLYNCKTLNEKHRRLNKLHVPQQAASLQKSLWAAAAALIFIFFLHYVLIYMDVCVRTLHQARYYCRKSVNPLVVFCVNCLLREFETLKQNKPQWRKIRIDCTYETGML